MNKFFLASVLVAFISLTAYPDYVPMIREGRVWEYEGYFSRNGESGQVLHYMKFDGTVTVNDKEYHAFGIYNSKFYEEFFMQILTGDSLFGNTGGMHFSRTDVGFLTYSFAQGKIWMFLSAGCILLVSFLFILLTAWRIDPLRASSGRKAGRRNQ